MKDLIIKVITEESKRLLNEGGIRDINKIAKRYPMAKIYFHQDLDGVTTALAMKNYLENNGIKVVDAEIIQYGGKEFAIHKPEGEGDIMPVLVDFAHGKPMFVIHTDHHDTQAGVEQGTSTNFKPSRSNVETISQSISPTDIFSQDDIETISMIDSADYAKYDITPEQVVQYLFKVDRTKGVKENKKMMGLVANKLLLAFKNKPDFLKKLVMDAKPSLQSILLNIKDIMEKEGYASIDQLLKNQESYIQARKEKGVTYEDGIISQYGLGPTMKSGGYDRYTPFINHPDAEFLVTGLPMGMVQASCNPYKKERALKGVDLGQIKDEVLEKFRPELERQRITFATLKRISEMDTDATSVGFTFKDFLAIYGNSPSLSINGSEKLEKYLDYKSKDLFKSIPPEDRKVFNKASVNGYDVIMANSGGHKCITNISGINYLYSNAKFQEPEQRVRNSYIDLLKDIQAEFVRVLKEKIEQGKTQTEMNESRLFLKKKDLKPKPTTFLSKKGILKEQSISLPITITDGFQAPKGDADALHSFERRRSDKFGGRMTSKIEKKLREVYDAGINPDVVDIKINVDSKEYKVTWSATIDESKDGKAYVGVSTRGSAGGGSDRRAEGQVEPLKQQLKKNGAEDITLALDFKNTGGVPIRQYFFKYTIPSKYPAHASGSGKYVRNNSSNNVGGTESLTDLTKGSSMASGLGFDFKSVFEKWKEKLKGKTMNNSQTSGTTSSDTPTEPTTDSGGGGENSKVEFGKIQTQYTGNAKKNIGVLISKMIEKGITDPKAQIGMLVTIGKESGFIPQNELPYTTTPAGRIRSIFKAAKGMSDNEINSLKKDPKKFFDVIYGPKGAGPGLGNTQPGDGSRYIGRGFNQITGRANYKKYGYENNPEALNDVGNAAKAAVDFLGKEGASLNGKFKTVEDAMKFFVTRNAGGRSSSRGEAAATKILPKFSIG